MLSRENRIIGYAAIVTIIGVAALAGIEWTVGFPGEWVAVLAFIVVVGFGFVLPQAYLMTIEGSLSRAPRMGVVTMMMLVVAALFSGSVTGTERLVLWGIVIFSIGVVFGLEASAGYRESKPHAEE